MKIRIQGNSIRLRLRREEVATLAAEGLVEDRLKFGPEISQHLVYRLEAADRDSMNTYFRDGAVVVELPRAEAGAWELSDRVGFEQTVEAEGESIVVLVEKDFKCLEERAGEDESDLFENPNAGAGC